MQPPVDAAAQNTAALARPPRRRARAGRLFRRRRALLRASARLARLVALGACAACTPVDPASLLAPLLSGDLDRGAAALVAADALPDGPTGEALAALQDDAARYLAARDQQRTLDRRSRELMRTAIVQLLAEDPVDDEALQRAAGLLAAAVEAWPDDSAFQQLAAELGHTARAAPAPTGAPALEALAELLAGHPGRAAPWQRAASRARLAADYAPKSLPATLAARAGVTEAAVADLLAIVDREYVVAPDWSRLSRAGALRLSWLVATEGARSAWPDSARLDLPPPRASDRETALADLHACVEAATAVGIPEAVVVSEWTEGALAALDRWTRPVWPAAISTWRAHHAGVRIGVGVELEQDAAGRVIVARPLPDGPAYEGGVHQGDGLVAITDERGRVELQPRRGAAALAAARDALAGPPGSSVRLDVDRDGRPLRFVLVRRAVVEQTVEGWARDAQDRWVPWLDRDAGLAYVRIRVFRPTTLAAFDTLLRPVADDLQALVLDLRDNPGGDVNAAVQIADRFVPGGWLTRISGRVRPETGPDTDPQTGQPLAEWNEAIPGDYLEAVPVLVLIDQGTASAAEVLAGALQERAHAHLLGADTWGKGYAQALRQDPAGRFAVQLTNLLWTLPSGRRLAHELDDGGGLHPQVSLGRTSPGARFRLDQDRALRTAVRHHADGSPMRPTLVPPRPELPPLDDDPAVLAATLLSAAAALGDTIEDDARPGG